MTASEPTEARGNRTGRPPSLSSRGRAWAAGGGALVLLGAACASWPLVGLGVAWMSALGTAYLLFYPTSVFIWRRHVELSWALARGAGEDAFVVGRPFRLAVTLCNRAPRGLGRARVQVFTSSTIEAGSGPLELQLDARRQATGATELVARQVGTWHLHGARVEVEDPLGLCTVAAYFSNSTAIRVLPRPAVRTAVWADARPTAGAPHEKQGLHAAKLRGLGGELRELREHVPGDPFKHIAWKATARTGKLMVRDLDRETMVTHWLLVDLGATMRRGAPGATKLDQAVDLACAYARAALEAGDRVGLLTFDGRVVAEVLPDDGPGQRRRLLEPLLDAMNAVDEDLTELTDSELVAQVARYLLHQEGVDARVDRVPPIDDPAWGHLATTPAGELLDLRVIHDVVERTLAQVAPARIAAIRAPTAELRKLRLYCRLRGIELPYRRAPEAGRRSDGMRAALERAVAGRGTQRVVIVSDLLGLDAGLPEVARVVKLARRRGHPLACVVPAARAETRPLKGDAAVAAELARWDETRRERDACRRVAALGVRVVPVGPADSAALLGAALRRSAARKVA